MPPRRIVSLCPSITETLVAIGARDLLVGATRFCTRPRGVLRNLPRVGGTKDPDVAAILALAPDVVFANREENRAEDVAALEASGVAVDVSYPRRVADVPDDVRGFGRRLGGGCAAAAEALAREIARETAALEAAPPSGAFRYAYWIWRDPWMTVSDDTYVADLLRLAGGANAYGDAAERYPTTTPEESLARGASVELFPDEPYPFSERRHGEEIARRFGAASRRIFVPGDDFCWHGARTLGGLRAARALRETAGRP
jgi:ABC-type Fe3+-hydroxamate transport system substrate-binding protein